MEFKESFITNDLKLTDQTVEIKRDIHINENARLTLDNCKVIIYAGAGITCAGIMTAAATAFVPSDNKDCGWAGIAIKGPASGGSSFKGCLFEGGRGRISERDVTSGGAISILSIGSGGVRFSDCIFKNNSAAMLGGAVFVRNNICTDALPQEKPLIEFNDCLFEDCYADYGGAAAVVYCASASFKACRFKNSKAVSGGAVYVYDNSMLDISECRFEDCRSTVAGGAVTCRYSYFRDAGSVYSCCASSGKDEQGGALYLEKSDSKMSGASFASCFAHSGGALRLVGGSTVVEKCAFIGCHASVAGCAMAASKFNDCVLGGSVFDGCVKDSQHGGGDTIAVKNADMRVAECVFKGRADKENSYFRIDGSSVKVDNCKFCGDHSGRPD